MEPADQAVAVPSVIESTSPIEEAGDIAETNTNPSTNVRVQDDNEYSFPFLIPFDGIPPVYDAKFAPANAAALVDEELIIGIAWSGEAKAYPISVLRFREMVNDELGGIPTLVTW